MNLPTDRLISNPIPKSLSDSVLFRFSLSQQNYSKHEKKRTGPGRKSNAEHAIAFYEYLVGEKGIGDKEDSERTNTPSGEDDENSSCDRSTTTSSSSSKTIDTEEFLNQHNDACDVCNLGGQLICCSTCTLVFHEECLRPVLKSIPSDWICPYCITQGINNYKRHSKTWKSAASGIRQMKRMKMEVERGSQQRIASSQNEVDKESIDKTDIEESKAVNTTKSTEVNSLKNDDTSSHNMEGNGQEKNEGQNSKSSALEQNPNGEDVEEKVKEKVGTAVGGNNSAASSISSAGAVSDSKRNLALYKIADSYSNSTENLLVHGRRQRKQPTLYQPQLCADSRWKSDEKNLETDRNDDDDTDSNNSAANTDRDTVSSEEDRYESKARRNNSRKLLKRNKSRDSKNQMEDKVVICIGEDAEDRKKSGSPFCNFCHDDASIPICVFCGCRTCFGKHDKATLLLCDNCDDEYHTQCLGLETVPSAQKWYCPACAKTKTTTTPNVLSTRRLSSAMAQASAVEAGSETDNSKRSSPMKKNRSSSTTTTRTPPLSTTRATDAEVMDKRGRGRPSKSKIEKESMPASLSPRKRVRTSKAVANSEEIVEQRKRGRQSKSITNTSATTLSIGKKRGRPPKNITTNSPPTQPKLPPSSPTPRKRGRPPKPNPDPVAVLSKADSTIKKKLPKPTTSVSTTLKKPGNSGVSEVSVKPLEPIKVSRVSGRTVKRASFHDEVDEGEQHLRSSKSPQSGESQSTNNASKTAPSKCQETQTHRTNSKSPELSEPVRKKPKIEEKIPTQTNSTPSETKSAKSQNKMFLVAEDKEEEMTDPPPIAPVRMKPVLQPPAPPIVPVRMKPILQPPASSIRLHASMPEKEKPKLIDNTELNVEKGKKSVNNTEIKGEEKIEQKVLQVDSAPTITKPEASTTKQPPPPTSLPPKTNKPTATIGSKATAPTSTTPRASPTFVQEISTSKSIAGTSAVPNYPSTPLLDPVALEAAVKARPEPKESKGEKTGITKTPRRKPGARECMQISRRFGVNIIPEKYMTTLLDYCRRGKVEHLIKMRERLDCHSRFLEYQLAGLESRVKEVGESKVIVPAMPPHKRDSSTRQRGSGGGVSPPPVSLNKKGGLAGSTSKIPVATQVPEKKLPLLSQTPAMANSKIRIENTGKKVPAKPTTGPKHSISSSITTAVRPTLPVPLANKAKNV